MTNFTRAGTLIGAMALSACTSVPRFHDLESDSNGEDMSKSIQDVIEHIGCELYAAENDNSSLAGYQVMVLLNVKVDDGGSLAPSFGFADHSFTAIPGVTGGLGLQYGETRERTFAEAVRVSMADLVGRETNADATMHKCSPDSTANEVNFDRPTLTGDLGLKQVARAGLNSIPSDGAAIFVPTALNSASGYEPPPDPKNPSTQKLPAFGSSLQFVLTKGANGGPNWSLQRFKGPTGTLPFLSLTRSDTDQLWIAFAPLPDSKHLRDLKDHRADLRDRLKSRSLTREESDDLSRTEAAIRNQEQSSDAVAQGLINTMIVQNLNLTGPIP
jgi:hypothetical protein